MQQQIDELRAQITEKDELHLNEVRELKNKMVNLMKECGDKEQKIQELDVKLTYCHNTIGIMNNEKDSLSKMLQEQSLKVNEKVTEMLSLDEHLKSLRRDFDSLTRERDSERSSFQATVDTLQSDK